MNNFHWPDSAVETLRDLWAEGLSITKIANRIGAQFKWPMSRNGVVGKAMRIGLPKRSQTASCAGPRKPRSQRPGRIASSVTAFMHMKQTEAKPEPVPEIQEEASAVACSILDLDSTRCTWVVGNPRTPLEAVYCGRKPFLSGCYCHEHWERSLTPEGRARMAAKMKQAA